MNVLLRIGNKVKFKIKNHIDEVEHIGSIVSISQHGTGIVALINGTLEVFNGQNEIFITSIKRNNVSDWES